MKIVGKLLNAILIIALMVALSPKSVSAASVECWLKQIFLPPSGCSGGGGDLPKIRIDTEHLIEFGFRGIEDVEDLKALIVATEAAAERLLQSLSDEYAAALQATMAELREGLQIVDEVLEKRINQIDAVISTKLEFILNFTIEVADLLESLIKTISTEASNLVSTTSEEIQQIFQKALTEARVSVQVVADELRLTVQEAGKTAESLIGKLSVEAQRSVQQLVNGLNEVVKNFEVAMERLIEKLETSTLVVVDGVLYSVERIFELTLTILAIGLGLAFLYFASMRWSSLLLKRGLPKPAYQYRLAMGLLIVTYLCAILPFIFLYKPIRAKALVSSGFASPYNAGDKFGTRFVRPKFTEVPEEFLIAEHKTLRLSGENLKVYGEPLAKYGEYTLSLVSFNSNLLIFDTELVFANPDHSKFIDIFLDRQSDVPDLRIRVVEPVLKRNEDVNLTPVATNTPSMVATVEVIAVVQVNVRNGPGAYAIIGSASPGQKFVATGKSLHGPWWRIDYAGGEGWIWADSVLATYGELVPTVDVPAYLPLATATPSPTPTPSCIEPIVVYFTVSSAKVAPGGEAELRWEVQHTQSVAVRYGDTTEGVALAGTLKVHPYSSSTYQLLAQDCSGQGKLLQELTIEVIEPVATSTPIRQPEVMQFDNGLWQWHQGSATNSASLLAPSAILFGSGSRTEQWATQNSALRYWLEIDNHDFEAQVTMSFVPEKWQQFAGLGVMSVEDPNTWIRIGKLSGSGSNSTDADFYFAIDQNVRGQSGKLPNLAINRDTTVYLKLRREASLFTFYYSQDGATWITLSQNHSFELSGRVALFMTIFSWGDKRGSAQFSDFIYTSLR